MARSAITRPFASRIDTISVSSIGAAHLSSRASASSREMVSVIGRIELSPRLRQGFGAASAFAKATAGKHQSIIDLPRVPRRRCCAV
jgi:hypothetical protein